MSNARAKSNEPSYGYKAATKQLAEPFVLDTEEMFSTLNLLAADHAGEVHPSRETADWAIEVLLHVLPRTYLRGAEVDAFKQEIHVSWECELRRVVAYFPGPQALKIYYEEVNADGSVAQHKLVNTDRPVELTHTLQWLFQR